MPDPGFFKVPSPKSSCMLRLPSASQHIASVVHSLISPPPVCASHQSLMLKESLMISSSFWLSLHSLLVLYAHFTTLVATRPFIVLCLHRPSLPVFRRSLIIITSLLRASRSRIRQSLTLQTDAGRCPWTSDHEGPLALLASATTFDGRTGTRRCSLPLAACSVQLAACSLQRTAHSRALCRSRGMHCVQLPINGGYRRTCLHPSVDPFGLHQHSSLAPRIPTRNF